MGTFSIKANMKGVDKIEKLHYDFTKPLNMQCNIYLKQIYDYLIMINDVSKELFKFCVDLLETYEKRYAKPDQDLINATLKTTLDLVFLDDDDQTEEDFIEMQRNKKDNFSMSNVDIDSANIGNDDDE